MADTIQGVYWAIEQKCPVRAGGQWQEPRTAVHRVRRLQTYWRQSTGADEYFGIVEGVCVTGSSSYHDPQDRRGYHVPCHGFDIAEEFGKWGGAQGLTDLCGTCPANAYGRPRLAACADFLSVFGWSREWEEQIQRLMDRLGIRRVHEEEFLQTTPVWPGLWASSRLGVRACGFLGALLDAVVEEDRAQAANESNRAAERYLEELACCAAAMRTAQRNELPMRVSMAPPGHVDLGWRTVFPHCPRCKTIAPVRRWMPQYPSQLVACPACGMEYSPAEMGSSERMKDDGPVRLRDQLGQERYEQVAVAWVMRDGTPREKAVEVVAAEAREHDERKRRLAIARERAAKEKLFLRRHILKELQREEDEDDEDGYSAAEARTILGRCAEHGVQVNYVIGSTNEAYFEESRNRKAPPDAEWAVNAVGRLEEKGCSKFTLTFTIPDDKLD